MSTTFANAPSTLADAQLNSLPHPVIVVARDGRIADANVAAEQFFEASTPMLRRHILRDLVPFGSPLLPLIEQVRTRGGSQRIQGRSVDTAQPEGKAG
jgi:two-component system nitrogen regulation sensor histidine kinase GlnL